MILLLVFVVEHAMHFNRKISVFARKKAKSLVTRYSTRSLRLKKVYTHDAFTGPLQVLLSRHRR